MMKHTLLVALASVSLAGLSSVSGSLGQPGGTPRSGTARGAEADWDALSARWGGTKADTKPCHDVTMSFTIPAEVRAVLVVAGQQVKVGDQLVRARDDEQQAVVDGQKIQAANRNRVENAKLQQELADLNFSRIQEARNQNSANPAEFDQRRIEASAAKIAVAQEETTHSLEQKRLEQAQGLLDRYRLTAQFAGIVEEVRVDPGQGVRESDPVLRLVDIQKLHLEAWPPTQETLRLGLKPGSKAWVLVSLPDKPLYVEGKVLAVSPVADSVSQTRRVEVEIENPELWPAGLPAMVRFTEPAGDWNGHRLSPGQKPTAAGADQGTNLASDAR